MNLYDVKCVKKQAYIIMVAIEGSWLVDATHPANDREKFCREFVHNFVWEHGWHDPRVVEELKERRAHGML